MNLKKITEILRKNSQPKFRLNQIIKAVYQDGVSIFSEISNISKNLREEFDAKIKILPFDSERILISADKKSIKSSLKLFDGNFIETVLLSANPGVWSACVSSQAGCPIGCAFCATGKGGFKRNLEEEEISGQILFWKQYMRKNKISGKLSNIVYMGMGEPFLNWEAVRNSLKDLTNKNLFGFGSRSISVSTAGIPGGLAKMAADFPQINLAISLHFCDDDDRSKFMPANRNFNLEDLKADLIQYQKRLNRKIFLEYILFKDINDNFEDAKRLASFVGSFKKPRLLHINLIRYNECENNKTFKPSGEAKIAEFQKYLLKEGINCTIRKSLGTDIQGACGQLTYSPII